MAIQNWVERVAAAFAQHFGLPPITGRILGWLLICDPPEQSAAEIMGYCEEHFDGPGE